MDSKRCTPICPNPGWVRQNRNASTVLGLGKHRSLLLAVHLHFEIRFLGPSAWYSGFCWLRKRRFKTNEFVLRKADVETVQPCVLPYTAISVIWAWSTNADLQSFKRYLCCKNGDNLLRMCLRHKTTVKSLCEKKTAQAQYHSSFGAKSSKYRANHNTMILQFNVLGRATGFLVFLFLHGSWEFALGS